METIDQLKEEAVQLNSWIEYQRAHRSNFQSAAQLGAIIEAEERLRTLINQIFEQEA